MPARPAPVREAVRDGVRRPAGELRRRLADTHAVPRPAYRRTPVIPNRHGNRLARLAVDAVANPNPICRRAVVAGRRLRGHVAVQEQIGRHAFASWGPPVTWTRTCPPGRTSSLRYGRGTNRRSSTPIVCAIPSSAAFIEDSRPSVSRRRRSGG